MGIGTELGEGGAKVATLHLPGLALEQQSTRFLGKNPKAKHFPSGTPLCRKKQSNHKCRFPWKF